MQHGIIIMTQQQWRDRFTGCSDGDLGGFRKPITINKWHTRWPNKNGAPFRWFCEMPHFRCNTWEQRKWNLIGDVKGASDGSQASSGKTLHEGKEYDFVFSVHISDTEPPIKLPYNRVANFIVKNSS